MDEYVMKQKIQKACFEPSPPEELIQQVILRARAVSMGLRAHIQLESAPVENPGELVACALVGQLAAVSKLPKGAQPEQLARQLEQQPAFVAALRGGNVSQRLNSGELLQQINRQKPEAEQMAPENAVLKKEGPVMG